MHSSEVKANSTARTEEVPARRKRTPAGPLLVRMGGSGRRSVLGAEAAAGPHRFGGTGATARSVWPYGVPCRWWLGTGGGK
nr:unnamed protein product [Digitaria exilis]